MQPKVLVVSINAWRDNSGVNTLMDFLQSWNADRVTQIYTRSDLPNTKVCSRFFQISETAVLRSIFRHGVHTGREVQNSPDGGKENNTIQGEQRFYSRFSGKSFFWSFAREFVWLLGKWKTGELKKFVEDVNPDVLFIPIYPTIYMGVIQKYIIKLTGKPYACYLADDNYTYKAIQKTPLKLIHRFFLRRIVRKLVTGCDRLFVIAPKQKEEYDGLFGVNSEILTKSIDPIPPEPLQVHQPIRMLYTGKLIIGRGNTLAMIAKQLEKVNENDLKISMDIYAPDEVSDSLKRRLNTGGCTLHKPVSHDEVIRLQKEADILVFVEGLERKNRSIARLSFSTKLTDYLKSGKCILAVADRNIAPMDYLRREDAAVMAFDEPSVYAALTSLAEKPAMIEQYGEKAYQTGLRNHNREKLEKFFAEEMQQIASRG